MRLGELLYLSAAAVADASQGLPPLGHGDEQEWSEGASPVVGAALAATLDGDSDRLVTLLQAHREVLTAGCPDLGVAIDVACAALRSPCTLPRGNPSRVRGLALRGIAFAMAPVAEHRYQAYHAYGSQRGVDPVWLATFAERWAQHLMTSGRLADADDLLRDRLEALPLTPESGWAHAGLLGARARTWRFAGDLEYALNLNSKAEVVLRRAGIVTWNEVWAGWHLNRGGILFDCGDIEGAYSAGVQARELYGKSGFNAVGEVQAEELIIACNPDPGTAAHLGRELIARDHERGLPALTRGRALRRAAEAVARDDIELALGTLKFVDTLTTTNRRDAAQAAFASGQLAATSRPERAMEWAHRAVERAQSQENRLLRARAGLLLARCEAQASDVPGAIQATNAALEELSHSLLGLTSQGEAQVMSSVAQDLRAVFDIAVDADDGELALRVAEIGRNIRLAALMRLDPTQLPDTVRTALANVTVAMSTAEVSSRRSGDRAAVAAPAVALADYESVVGPILRTVTAQPDQDLDRHRAVFADTHLLALSEHEGVLRWVWWPPGADRAPLAGRVQLPRRTRALIGHLVAGDAEKMPGSLEDPLTPLLPPPLHDLLATPADPISLLITPTGRLWHVPFLAASLPGQRRLIDAARVTLAPSLGMAHALSERDHTLRRAEQRVSGYCNPRLPGAALEAQSLHRHWADLFEPLPGVARFGATHGVALTVMSTHADNGLGLAQALRDHSVGVLTAGQCLVREFPRGVVLGACHGYDAHANVTIPEPIGLVTVISARGATWVVGGYQRLTDATVGWILSRTYCDMHAGQPLPIALRSAQRTYLHHISRYDLTEPKQQPTGVPDDLHQIVAQVGGPSRALLPWSWALTALGPPA